MYKEILNYYNNLNSKEIFKLCLIFIVLYVYFKNIIVTLLLFIIIFVIINTYNSQYDTSDTFISNELFPKSKMIEKNDKIKNLLFFIQDFYYYSPENYITFVSNLDTFLLIYNDILIDNKLAGKMYNLLEKKKFIILHYLDAIKINCPDDRKILEKINSNINEIENILNNYLYDTYEKNQIYIKNNGYNVDTKLINLNLKLPHNESFLDD